MLDGLTMPTLLRRIERSQRVGNEEDPFENCHRAHITLMRISSCDAWWIARRFASRSSVAQPAR